jgi:hypothetical protein
LPPIEIETSATSVTVIAIEPLMVPSVAVTVIDPAFTPVKTPAEFMIPIVVSEDFHATWDETSPTDPSLNLPWATNWSVAPVATDVAELGVVTVIEASVLVLPELCDFDLLLPPPQPERPRQTIKIEPTNAPIFFIVQTSSSK